MARAPRWPRLEPEPSWAGVPDEERARAIEAACLAAVQQLADLPDREQRLRRVDPLPSSTRELLRRLASTGDG